MALGGWNPLPFRLGGGKSTQRAIYESLNAGLGTAFDTTDESTVAAETTADAFAIAALWRANKRLSNEWDPRRMTDMLGRAEDIFDVRPGANDSNNRRRAVLQAKFLRLGGDAFGTLDELCELLLGDVFIQLERTALADSHSNWPGGTPSVLDRWDSTVAHLLVRVERYDNVDITLTEFLDRLRKMMTEMRDYTSAWTETDWAWDGTGGAGFYLDEDWNLDGEAFDV